MKPKDIIGGIISIWIIGIVIGAFMYPLTWFLNGGEKTFSFWTESFLWGCGICVVMVICGCLVAKGVLPPEVLGLPPQKCETITNEEHPDWNEQDAIRYFIERNLREERCRSRRIDYFDLPESSLSTDNYTITFNREYKRYIIVKSDGTSHQIETYGKRYNKIIKELEAIIH